jgi:hypothetical protein
VVSTAQADSVQDHISRSINGEPQIVYGLMSKEDAATLAQNETPIKEEPTNRSLLTPPPWSNR